MRDSKTLTGSVATSQQLKSIGYSSLLVDAIQNLKSQDAKKWKVLIYPVDQETPVPSNITSLIQEARENHIRIFPVDIDNGSYKTVLQDLAEQTYGQYYAVPFDTSQDAVEVLSGIYDRIKEEEDADADGIFDTVETAGMRITDGSFVKTSISLDDENNDGIPDGQDSDSDGLMDGYEMGYVDRDGNALVEAKLAMMNLDQPKDMPVSIASLSNSTKSTKRKNP